MKKIGLFETRKLTVKLPEIVVKYLSETFKGNDLLKGLTLGNVEQKLLLISQQLTKNVNLDVATAENPTLTEKLVELAKTTSQASELLIMNYLLAKANLLSRVVSIAGEESLESFELDFLGTKQDTSKGEVDDLVNTLVFLIKTQSQVEPHKPHCWDIPLAGLKHAGMFMGENTPKVASRLAKVISVDEQLDSQRIDIFKSTLRSEIGAEIEAEIQRRQVSEQLLSRAAVAVRGMTAERAQLGSQNKSLQASYQELQREREALDNSYRELEAQREALEKDYLNLTDDFEDYKHRSIIVGDISSNDKTPESIQVIAELTEQVDRLNQTIENKEKLLTALRERLLITSASHQQLAFFKQPDTESALTLVKLMRLLAADSPNVSLLTNLLFDKAGELKFSLPTSERVHGAANVVETLEWFVGVTENHRHLDQLCYDMATLRDELQNIEAEDGANDSDEIHAALRLLAVFLETDLADSDAVAELRANYSSLPAIDNPDELPIISAINRAAAFQDLICSDSAESRVICDILAAKLFPEAESIAGDRFADGLGAKPVDEGKLRSCFENCAVM